jgi:hypothetical protein
MENKMKLIQFTEILANKPVSINPEYVVAVFEAKDGEYVGKTVIGVINGSVIVQESLETVLAAFGE